MRVEGAQRRVRMPLAGMVVAAALSSAVGCGGLAATQANKPPVPSPTLTPTPSPTPSPTDPWPPVDKAGLVPAALFLSKYEGALVGFDIDLATGALLRRGGARFGNGTGRVAAGVAPDGRLAVVGVGADGAAPFAAAYRLSAGGRIEAIDTPPVALPSGFTPRKVVVHPTRRLVYLLDDASQSIYGLRVSADGALSPVSGSPFHVPSDAFVIHPRGGFAYAAGGSLVLCSIGEDGALVQRASYEDASYCTEQPGTGAVAIDRAGRFLITNGVKVYTIDAQSGELSLAASLAERAVTLTTHPSADIVYILHDVSSSERDIGVFRLQPETGELSPSGSVRTTPPHHGMYALLGVEPGGRFLYHTGTENIDETAVVRAFPIQADGALTPSIPVDGELPPAGRVALARLSYPSDFVLFLAPKQ